jgi:predicted nucleic acid-binding protein
MCRSSDDEPEASVILYLSFEELTALSAEAERVLDASAAAGHGIAAPPRLLAEVEQFAQLLTGDVGVSTLEQQRSIRRVVDHLLDGCRFRMDALILDQHPAAEGAVAAYFDYAHVLSASSRIDRLGTEMEVLLQVMTGEDPDSEAGRRFSFPE